LEDGAIVSIKAVGLGHMLYLANGTKTLYVQYFTFRPHKLSPKELGGFSFVRSFDEIQ